MTDTTVDVVARKRTVRRVITYTLVALLIGYVLYGAIHGDIAHYGWSLWLADPFDWRHNVDFGLSNGHWFFMVNTV